MKLITTQWINKHFELLYTLVDFEFLFYSVGCLVLLIPSLIFAQSNPNNTVTVPEQRQIKYDTGFWLGLYTTYHISDKWSYYGEYHLRRADGLNDMSKLYLRFGGLYKLDRGLQLTVGIVNRYTWSENPEDPNEEVYVPEFRFWEQLVFKVRALGMKFYHQLRTEQRWRRSTSKLDPNYYYYNRFRYKLNMYIPVIGTLMKPGSVYLSLYNEIFMQAGEKIEYNFFEDNRAYAGIAYAINQDFHVHVGYMKSFGQLDAITFRDNDIIRLSLYNTLDFR